VRVPAVCRNLRAFIPCSGSGHRGVGWRIHRFAPARLCGGIPSIHVFQCRVPPSPPAIRDMKKPRLRIRRGFDFLRRAGSDVLRRRLGRRSNDLQRAQSQGTRIPSALSSHAERGLWRKKSLSVSQNREAMERPMRGANRPRARAAFVRMPWQLAADHWSQPGRGTRGLGPSR
jgi:hypothetical protein